MIPHRTFHKTVLLKTSRAQSHHKRSKLIRTVFLANAEKQIWSAGARSIVDALKTSSQAECQPGREPSVEMRPKRVQTAFAYGAQHTSA